MLFNNIVQNFTTNYAGKIMQRSLERAFEVDILSSELKKIPNPNKKYMLYAHVPFCHTFCPYCSFHKYAYDEDLCKEYFVNLRKELLMMKEAGYEFDSMYVGGGTTLIDEYELLKTLELAKKTFNIAQISCETDPNHIEPKKLSMFKGVIDRLSVGVQSFDNDILKKVARYTKFGDKNTLIEKLSKAIDILPILSLDLIFNFPFQTKEALIDDIKTAKMLNPQQITLYPLMKSNITKEAIAKTLGVSSVDNEKEFYRVILDEFKDYHQNNAWSFSKKLSNLKDEYVGQNHEYVGIGSGAFSFLDGRLLINAFNLKAYSNFIQKSQSPVIAKCDFSKNDRIKYIFLTELFDGDIDIDEFNLTHSCDLKKDLFAELWLLKLANALSVDDGVIKLNDLGRYICVILMKEFYIGMDRVRATFRDDTKIKSAKKLKIIEKEKNLHKKRELGHSD
ncbi:MAG: coproporphyrinogen III oxidase family protein [Campylobacter sp.]|nr:coproporphyrinogen III oxidase family protein [Campylobacter sp.]